MSSCNPSAPRLAAGATYVTVATCSLNQWALDFDGNVARIRESIHRAKQAGASYRLGPELEVPGYMCEDHFLEMDTFTHSWEALADLLADDTTDGILCDIGMPVLFRGTRYNCRIWVLDRKILLIRPKMFNANDGNYRETRYFTPWGDQRISELEEIMLPGVIVAATGGQRTAPFGIGIIETNDARLCSETCEELFTIRAPHGLFALNGVDIVGNGSGSHHQLRKLNYRIDAMKTATGKAGGVYLYSNQQGCDGQRLYFDGCSSVLVNGDVVAQGSQFGISDIEMVLATVDLDAVRSLRASLTSHGAQTITATRLPVVRADYNLHCRLCQPTPPRPLKQHTCEEEIGYGPACWLWDYLRRSGASGFFLPLSGGADSASTAAIVGIMCHKVYEAIMAGDTLALGDLRRMTGEEVAPAAALESSCASVPKALSSRVVVHSAAGGGMHVKAARLDDGGWIPASPAAIAERLFHTTYMGTENSSQMTRARAEALASQIGAYHVNMTIDTVVAAMIAVFAALFGKTPVYSSQGGTWAEDLALQNIQARLRMVFSYLLAQLLPWVRGRKGFLLVLGSANVDEALRGYYTKYDCSAADINPIGGVAKGDLKAFLLWASEKFSYPALADVVAAPPSAELRPTAGEGEHTQTDEDDMGMTYEELGWFGRLRKVHRCGPLSMYTRLLHQWGEGGASVPKGGPLAPSQVAEKVKRFFKFYSINRHKMTTLTPSYHAENYSPDDNRFDHRPFLYPVSWHAQFRAMDADAAAREAEAACMSGASE